MYTCSQLQCCCIFHLYSRDVQIRPWDAKMDLLQFLHGSDINRAPVMFHKLAIETIMDTRSMSMYGFTFHEHFVSNSYDWRKAKELEASMVASMTSYIEDDELYKGIGATAKHKEGLCLSAEVLSAFQNWQTNIQ
jgi:hypothetical protein